ncbi:MAG: response regulator transcription factor [Bacteroidales bacterium]|nr:response regulator transcription factor [Bacteroidales bacterium]
MRRIIVINDQEDNNSLYEKVLSKVYVNHYLRNFDQVGDALKYLKLNTIHYIIIDMCSDLSYVLEKIERLKPEANVIVISQKDERECISTAIKFNVKGIVAESKIEKEINTAIEAIDRGERFFSQELATIALNEVMQKEVYKDKDLPTLKDLTKREIQILELILQELTNQEIAEQLFVSPRTIDTHRRNLLQKVRAKNTVGLVKFAFRNKLIS